MEMFTTILAVAGLIIAVVFGYLQVAVPFIKREVTLTRKFPFVEGSEAEHPEDARHRMDTDSGDRVVLLFTDIVEYTARKFADDTSARSLLGDFKSRLEALLSKYGGKEVTVTGDEFLIEFTNPVDAVLFGVELQGSVNKRNSELDSHDHYHIRVGIHQGPVDRTGRGLSGAAVEIVSGIEPLAEPGGVTVTGPVMRRISRKMEIQAERVDTSLLEGSDMPGDVFRLTVPASGVLPPIISTGAGGRKRRNRVLASGVAIIALVGIYAAGYFLFTEEVESGEPIPVAVVDIDNMTGEQELDGLSGMLITALEQSRHLSVLTRTRMFDVLEQIGNRDVEKIDEILGREICMHTDLDILIIASIRKFGDLYTIDLKVLDPGEDRYLFTTSIEGRDQESIPGMIDELSERARIGLEEKLEAIRIANEKIAAVTTANLEAYQHYFEGEEYLNKLMFEEAEEEFRKAIAQDSTFGLAWYRLSYAIGWFDEEHAREPLERALELIDRIPEKERYLVRATAIRDEQGNSAGAAVLEEAAKIYPNDKEILFNIGDWLYHDQQYVEARAYLERVLELDPNLGRALQHLSWIYRALDDYEAMTRYAERYVTVTGSVEAYVLLSQVYAFTGRLDQAMETLDQVLVTSPNDGMVLNAVGDILLLQEEYEHAAAEYAKLIEGDRPIRETELGYWGLIESAVYRGRYREALEFADELSDVYAGRSDTAGVATMYVIESVLFTMGINDRDRARDLIEKSAVYGSTSEHIDYLRTLAMGYVLTGDIAAAERVLDRKPDHPRLQVIRDFVRIYIHAVRGECGLAEALLIQTDLGNKALSLIMNSTLALCYLDGGLPDRALPVLEEIQSTYDHDLARAVVYPESFYLMGRAYEGTGDPDRAIECYEKLFQLWDEADPDLVDLVDARRRLEALKR